MLLRSLFSILMAAMLPIYAEAPGPGAVDPPPAPPGGVDPPKPGEPGAPPAPKPGDPPAPPPAPKPGDAPAVPPKPGEKSILSLGKDEADKDGIPKPGADPVADKIPEKYRVYVGEGDQKKLDVQASTLKLAEAHAQLESRAGAIGLPPEKAADYKLPESLKEANLPLEELDGPALKAFRDRAHAAGYTQKQFDAAIEAHFAGVHEFMTQIGEQGATLARAELEKDPEWAGDKLTPMTKLAYRTFAAFATPAEMAEIDRIGNNPVFLKVLARAGKDLGEDRLGRGTGVVSVLDQSTLDEYMKAGSPYWDATHPDHKKYVDAVRRHHEAKFGTRPIFAAAA